MSPQRFFSFVLLLAAGVQAAYYYPLMPVKMASHFNAAGRANGWMPKEGFFLLYGLAVILMSVTFIIVPRYLLKLPDSMINLPHKSYWLAAGRRHETCAMIARYMTNAGNLTIALLLCIFQMTFAANREKESGLPEYMWLPIAVFAVLMGVWCVRFIRAFRIPPPFERTEK